MPPFSSNLNIWVSGINGAMTEQVAITGAYGTIGSVLRSGLEDRGHDVTAIDVAERAADEPDAYRIDLAANRYERDWDGSQQETTEYRRLKEVLEDQDAVIHLAWNIPVENFDTDRTAPENKWMTENIYEAARETGVDTVIMGSSIHAAGLPAYAHGGTLDGTPEPYRSVIADRERRPDDDALVSPYATLPDSPYGETKAYHMEQLGRQYALETDGAPATVVDARFGGVNETDTSDIPDEPLYETIASSHRNTVAFVDQALQADQPGYFKGYVMSDNPGCPYELGIPALDIRPIDRADGNGGWTKSAFIPAAMAAGIHAE